MKSKNAGNASSKSISRQWLTEALDLCRDTRWLLDPAAQADQMSPEFAQRLEGAANVAFGTRKVRKEQQRIGFGALSFCRYVEGLAELSSVSLEPILAWLGLCTEDLQVPNARTARALARLAREMGLLKVGTISIDGTHIKANASKYRSVRYDRLKELDKKLREDIESLMKQAESADTGNEEKEKDRLPEEIGRRKALAEKIAEAKKRLESREREDDDDKDDNQSNDEASKKQQPKKQRRPRRRWKPPRRLRWKLQLKKPLLQVLLLQRQLPRQPPRKQQPVLHFSHNPLL